MPPPLVIAMSNVVQNTHTHTNVAFELLNILMTFDCD